MITIIYGDNQVLSRKHLQEIKEKFQSRGVKIVMLDGKKASFDQIQLASQTQSLLGESAVFVEEFFCGRKSKAAKHETSMWDQLAGEIIFWESKELAGTLINNFPKAWKIQNFPVSRKTFQFLDAVGVGTAKTALLLLREVIETDTEYVVLPTLAWHIRSLLCTKVDQGLLSGPAWKKQKLLNQAKKFDTQQLLALHTKLLRLDRSQKAGTLDIPLSHALDLVVAGIYN